MKKKGRAHCILEQPRDIPKEHVKPFKNVLIITATDHFFIENRNGSVVDIGLGSVFLLSGLWVIYPFNVFFSPNRHWLEYIIFLCPIYVGLFMIIKGIFKPKKYMQLQLDRLKGRISYPNVFFGKPLEGPFHKLVVVFFAVSGDIDGYSPQEYLKAVNTFRPRRLDLLKTLSFEDPRKEWSLYVWYMDKNRPLPPGTAFDPYRQKDFERRKAEGFPKPLYPSNIPTPEATPEQQQERLRIGGW